MSILKCFITKEKSYAMTGLKMGLTSSRRVKGCRNSYKLYIRTPPNRNDFRNDNVEL